MIVVILKEGIDIEAEARLDSSIQFPHALSSHALSPRAVCLTGATGFLGAYLLDELLRKTDTTVYCIVRANSTTEASQRLVSHLQSCGLWQEDAPKRIKAVAGDLTQPRFGLGEDHFADLAGHIDVIYHAAGWLNMAFSYARLKPVNVTGTLEVLRLAGLKCTKPVHFLSSMAVFFSDAHANADLLRETDAPLYDPSLKGGYSKAKWVADRMAASAQQRGLPVCIYRPVRVMGHSKTGASHDLHDVLPLLLKGCILMGQYPAFDIEVTMVPVEYVSQAIVHLSGQDKSRGRAFHFFHPAPVSWSRLMHLVRELGYPLEEVAYDEWWRELKHRTREAGQSHERKSFFGTLMLALTAPHFLFYKRPPLDASYTHEGLQGTDIVCPPIDRDLLATYLTYWQKSGYLRTS